MTIDEFKNTELKVGRVLSAERVEGSEKLLKMQVSLGGDPEEIRQILAGIGKAYTPEEMVGKNIIVVVNLDPRTLMGEESRGMMLAATDEEGLPVALTVERDVSPGTEIR
ncbi:MAG: methionine--tRNA ligase subunit beta [Patescibacteria group bacterium]